MTSSEAHHSLRWPLMTNEPYNPLFTTAPPLPPPPLPETRIHPPPNHLPKRSLYHEVITEENEEEDVGEPVRKRTRGPNKKGSYTASNLARLSTKSETSRYPLPAWSVVPTGQRVLHPAPPIPAGSAFPNPQPHPIATTPPFVYAPLEHGDAPPPTTSTSSSRKGIVKRRSSPPPPRQSRKRSSRPSRSTNPHPLLPPTTSATATIPPYLCPPPAAHHQPRRKSIQAPGNLDRRQSVPIFAVRDSELAHISQGGERSYQELAQRYEPVGWLPPQPQPLPSSLPPPLSTLPYLHNHQYPTGPTQLLPFVPLPPHPAWPSDVRLTSGLVFGSSSEHLPLLYPPIPAVDRRWSSPHLSWSNMPPYPSNQSPPLPPRPPPSTSRRSKARKTVSPVEEALGLDPAAFRPMDHDASLWRTDLFLPFNMADIPPPPPPLPIYSGASTIQNQYHSRFDLHPFLPSFPPSLPILEPLPPPKRRRAKVSAAEEALGLDPAAFQPVSFNTNLLGSSPTTLQAFKALYPLAPIDLFDVEQYTEGLKIGFGLKPAPSSIVMPQCQ